MIIAESEEKIIIAPEQGFEPSTLCLLSRRSSLLSHIVRWKTVFTKKYISNVNKHEGAHNGDMCYDTSNQHSEYNIREQK